MFSIKKQLDDLDHRITTSQSRFNHTVGKAEKKDKDKSQRILSSVQIEKIQQRIEQLENERQSSTMSIAEERKLHREVERLNSELRGNDKLKTQVGQMKESITSLRAKRKEASDRLRERFSAIRQVEVALRKAKLAERLSESKGETISPADLVEQNVSCPADKLGLLVGKKGAMVAELESRFAVKIFVPQDRSRAEKDNKENKDNKEDTHFTVIGLSADVKLATIHAMAVVGAVKKRLALTANHVQLLMNRQSQELKAIEEKHIVRIEANRGSELAVQGAEECVDAAIADLNKMSVVEVTIPLPDEDAQYFIIGSKGTKIHALQEETGAILFVSREEDQSFIRITAFEHQVWFHSISKRRGEHVFCCCCCCCFVQ